MKNPKERRHLSLSRKHQKSLISLSLQKQIEQLSKEIARELLEGHEFTSEQIVKVVDEKLKLMQKATNSLLLPEEEILSSAKKYYEENRDIFLKRYKGKYIAILKNKVIGSDKDFPKLAQRVYKKYGYQTIYMPFVDEKEKVVRIPSPRIEIME